MRNILNLKVNLPSKLLETNWDIYYRRYRELEKRLLHPDFKINWLKRHLHSTGSFQLPLHKFNKNNDSCTNYFKGDSRRVIRMKTKVLLRGLSYFPGVIESINDISKIDLMFKEIEEIVKALHIFEKSTDIISFLAIIDCLKNYYLIILNTIDNSFKISCPQYIDKKTFFNLINLIQLTEYYYFKSIFNQSIYWSHDITSLFNSENIREYLIYLSSTNIKDGKQSVIRKMRECNNPYKIINFADSVGSKYLPAKTVIVSFAYGGIELPFAINAIRTLKDKSTQPMAICNLSSYSIDNIQYVQDLSDTLSYLYTENFFNKFEHILIIDDSVTTGKTIQNFLNLCPKSIKSAYLGFVSFTNSNRYHHLTRPHHGGINPEVLKHASIGFTSNFAKTYKKFSYTNKNGTFDKEKAKIIKLLNNSYLNI